jgi:hypothetical protein
VVAKLATPVTATITAAFKIKVLSMLISSPQNKRRHEIPSQLNGT